MTLMTVIGSILLAGGVGVAIYLVFFFKKGNPAESVRAAWPEKDVLPSDRIPEVRTAEKLKVVQSGQTVTMIGETERQVMCSVSLYEMTQTPKGAPWSRTGVVSKGLELAGGIFIFKVPGREGGKAIWLKAKEIDTLPLQDFYRGDAVNFGPAKQFNKNGQTSPVPYELPNDLTPGVTWQVVDIGTFNVEADGESETFQTGDRTYFVSSTEKGGDRRLLYLDARKGEARGTGGLFLCEPFEPSVEVSDLL